MAHLAVSLLTLLSVVLAVMLHYEAGTALSRLMARSSLPHRQRILLLLFGLLAAHVLTIWLFGITIWLLSGHPELGQLTGYPAFTFLDCVYLSSVTYTTLGYGDVIPVGNIRFLLGSEALTGFMLITWSASLTFIEMQRHWRAHDRSDS